MPLTDSHFFGPVVPADLRPLTSYVFDRSGSDAPAFTFLDHASDRDGIEHTMSWAELADQVRAVAAELSRLTGRGGRVAILAPQHPAYVVAFLGALHAGTVAVPLFAPEASRHGGRLVHILSDCAPEVWLTSTDVVDQVRALAQDDAVPAPKHIVTVEELAARGGDFTAPEIALDEPAYLQYTSGSTRDPAGAVITHRAVVANSWQAATAYRAGARWTVVGWLPFFHDMGLIQLLAAPVFAGCRSVFMAPYDFVKRPVRWLRAMSGRTDVMSSAPNFAFEYAARKTAEADRAGLDLTGVRVLITGSEPVRADTIAEFQRTFAPHGLGANVLRPSYGLAEATVFVTATGEEGPVVTAFDRAALAGDRGVPVVPGSPGAVDVVAAGRPVSQRVHIVHPERLVALPDGTVGEIWVDGPNVAAGYWQQPERSEETFGGRREDVPGRWLRTGDLGMIHDGLLYITGRMKDLIIIDGRNHYPQDIEATVSDAHPAIRRDGVAAFPVHDESGAEGAAVVAEYRRGGTADETEIGRAVRRAVSTTHDLRLRDLKLVQVGAVARTSSGKVARSATKQRHWEQT
ncbi:fatty acyl-AMP ligase [Streptomyces sp. NPDC020800]|uniref:fatty acyl-AMP ligase n=1 Tax=Streptomyces sp. NPDC020800 TaxID=3365092 RepID=UPI0037AD205C